jgi:orotidine-5'-phosphate decarboxylase
MLTLHIAGGEIMLRAAACAADEEARRLKIRPPLLVGVTRLTSQEARPEEILKLARLGRDCALDGVVCSAREVRLLRKKLGNKFIIVTPGIRPPLAAKDDQKRVATAADAARAGSDFLVVGRPILEAPDPVLAAQRISEEIWKR